MKKLLFIAVFVCISLRLLAFSGHITTNTTWSSDVIITGDVWVDTSVTLIIDPGVKVLFAKVDGNADGIGDVDFIVYGRLICQGTANSRVYFTSNETSPAPADWGGIQYLTPSNGALTTISYVTIEFANGGVYAKGKDITINSGYIANSKSYGFKGEGGVINLNGVIVSANSGNGMWFKGSQTTTLQDCRSITNALDGIYVEGGATPSFTNCVISDNLKNGVQVSGSGSNPQFTTTSVINNSVSGFFFGGGSSASVSYSCITGNGGYGVKVEGNSTPVFNYNNIHGNSGLDNSSSILTKTFGPNDWKCVGVQTLNDPTFTGSSQRFIVSATYMKDADQVCTGDWYGLDARLRTQILFKGVNLSAFDDYAYQSTGLCQSTCSQVCANLPLKTVTGSINQWMTSASDFKLALIQQEDCANPRAWMTSYTYQESSPLQFQVINMNDGGYVADFQNNWWGQLSRVDTLIYQNNQNTVNFAQLQTGTVAASCANLPNQVPVMSVLTPATLALNPSSVTISWTDGDMDNNAKISLYYGTAKDSTGTLITSNINEDSQTNSYSWLLSGVPQGVYYVYGIINDGVNTNVISYAPDRVMVGPVTAKAPLTATGSPGATGVAVPIHVINTINDFNITTFQFTLSYYPGKLTATGISQTGTLSDTWTVFTNTNIAGEITVSGFGSVPLNQSGVLIEVLFDVNATAGDNTTSPLDFSTFNFNGGAIPNLSVLNGLFTVKKTYAISGNTLYYNPANNPAVKGVVLTLSGGSTASVTSDSTGVFMTPAVIAGSYTLTPSCNTPAGKGMISPYDAAKTLRNWISIESFTSQQKQAADVNGDTFIDAADANLIAGYSVGNVSAFSPGRWAFSPTLRNITHTGITTNQDFSPILYGDPSGNWTAKGGLSVNTPDTIAVTVGSDQNISNGAVVSIPINVSSVTNLNVLSVYVKLKFNPAVITPKAVSKSGAITSSWITPAVNSNVSGELIFALYGTSVISGSGLLATVDFNVTGTSLDYSDIKVDSIIFNEGDPAVKFTDGFVGQPRSLSTNPLPASTYCSGDTVSVSFAASGPISGTNVFNVELSDGNGSFSSPVVIGTLAGNIPAVISAIIPAITADGTQYRIRVVSTDIVITGTDNGSNLSIYQTPAIPQIIFNGIALSSSAVSGNQWYFNGGIIVAATSQIYVPQQNGFFTVEVSNNGCSSVSAPYNFLSTSMKSLPETGDLRVFPNPSTGKFSVSGLEIGSNLQIYNTVGQLIHSESVKTTPYEFEIENKVSGLYMLLIQSRGQMQKVKLIVE